MGNSNHCFSSWSFTKELCFSAVLCVTKPVVFLALYDCVNVSLCQFNTCSVFCRKLHTCISVVLLGIKWKSFGPSLLHLRYLVKILLCSLFAIFLSGARSLCLQYTVGIGLPSNNEWFVAGSLEIADCLFARYWIFRNMVSVSSQPCAAPVAFAEHGGGCGRSVRTNRALGTAAGAKARASQCWSLKTLGALLCTQHVAWALWDLEEAASCRTSSSLWI